MRACIALILLLLSQIAIAVEVAPNIGFRHYYAPNGGEFDPSSSYRTETKGKQYAMNDQLLGRNEVSKIVPDFNSVGLDFTFHLD